MALMCITLAVLGLLALFRRIRSKVRKVKRGKAVADEPVARSTNMEIGAFSCLLDGTRHMPCTYSLIACVSGANSVRISH